MAVLSPFVIFYQSNPSPVSTGCRRRLQPIYKLMVMDVIVVVVISYHDIAFAVVKMVAVYLYLPTEYLTLGSRVSPMPPSADLCAGLPRVPKLPSCQFLFLTFKYQTRAHLDARLNLTS